MMIQETFTKEEKREIASHIKDISMQTVEEEMNRLLQLGHNAHTMPPRSNLGNNIVDYFTFLHRLETKGKYNATFFEFLANLDIFKQKKFIQNMLTYYEQVKNKNNTKHPYKVYKEVYNICISAINIMRPLNCMEIYSKYNAKRVLNFCAGWGGSTVAACALQLSAFYGIEINTDLQEPYSKMTSYLQSKSATVVNMYFCDAVTFDYSTLQYDTVFSSPPYYFIEKYPHNHMYSSKTEMDTSFYIPLFTNTYKHLQVGGVYIINICKEVYDNVLTKLLGPANEIFPLKKSKRQNDHTEYVYVWKKEQ